MIQNVLQETGGIGIYGVISICLFVLVFASALVRAAILNKNSCEALSALPLQDDHALKEGVKEHGQS